MKTKFFTILIVLSILLQGQTSPVFAKEDDTVWRVQLYLKTADVKDADSNDTLWVRLNSNYATVVNYAGKDLRRSSNNTYVAFDLYHVGVQRISDITMLRLSKPGKDGWCLESLKLVVNDKPIYTRSFQTMYKRCLWLDEDNKGGKTLFDITSRELRSNSAWKAYRQPLPPLRIPGKVTESLIESMVGYHIFGTKLFWGHLSGRAVEASRGNTPQTVHIDLDLAADTPNWWDPDVDIDFDLVVECVDKGNQKELSFTTQNVKVKVDSAWYSEVTELLVDELLLPIIDVPSVDDVVSQRVKEYARGFNYSISNNVRFCPSRIDVEKDGTITFGL